MSDTNYYRNTWQHSIENIKTESKCWKRQCDIHETQRLFWVCIPSCLLRAEHKSHKDQFSKEPEER